MAMAKRSAPGLGTGDLGRTPLTAISATGQKCTPSDWRTTTVRVPSGQCPLHFSQLLQGSVDENFPCHSSGDAASMKCTRWAAGNVAGRPAYIVPSGVWSLYILDWLDDIGELAK